jgi:hypothetical protein
MSIETGAQFAESFRHGAAVLKPWFGPSVHGKGVRA